MKKLVALGLGTCAAAASAALVCAAVASSDPNAIPSQYSVVGEPYGKAVAILQSQGVNASFGGSVGSDMPQAQCIVNQQKVIPGGKMALILDCTEKAADDARSSTVAGGSGGPGIVGSNGVTTVKATPVGPQPGMPIPGT